MLLKNGYTTAGWFARTLNEKAQNYSTPSLNSNFMHESILQAMEAVGRSAPNPQVGCVVVEDQKIISAGSTQSYGQEHAERMALRGLAKEKNIEIYVTLEPCAKVGHQPPCLDLLLEYHPKKIVIGSLDPDIRTRGKSWCALKGSGVEVSFSDLSNEAIALNLPFFHDKIFSKPLWAAKWAQKQDGDLIPQDGSRWITNEKSRAASHWYRQKYDAIVVGAQTYLIDQPNLNTRDCALPHARNPHRIVIDPKGRIEKLRALDDRPWIWVGPKSSSPKSTRSYDSVVEVDGEVWSSSKIKSTVEGLRFDGRPLQSILVEGGPALLSLLQFEFNVFHQWVKGTKDAPSLFSGRKQQILLSEIACDEDHLYEWISPEFWKNLELLKTHPI